jgi:hypothetical protein
MAGGSCKAETVEALCTHFGLELVPRAKKRKAR